MSGLYAPHPIHRDALIALRKERAELAILRKYAPDQCWLDGAWERNTAAFAAYGIKEKPNG